jgi:hypothetical protein
MPSIEESHVTWTQAQDIPDIFAGEVSFKGNKNGTETKYIFANGAVAVRGKGFRSATDISLVDAKVGQMYITIRTIKYTDRRISNH